MKRITVIALFLLAACDTPQHGHKPPPTCEELVCDLVPACSPLTTAGWDWRTEAACLDTFACGATPGACLDAIEALPCLSQPPTWEEIEANTRALVAVREACR